MRPTYEWLRQHIESAAREVATWPAWKRNEATAPMTQETCALLIADWFEMRGINGDAVALASWLYAGGDVVSQGKVTDTYQRGNTPAASGGGNPLYLSGRVPPAIPKLGPYGEGSNAWSAGCCLGDCPYEFGSGEHLEWQEGWLAAKRDNGQFGVGA